MIPLLLFSSFFSWSPFPSSFFFLSFFIRGKPRALLTPPKNWKCFGCCETCTQCVLTQLPLRSAPFQSP